MKPTLKMAWSDLEASDFCEPSSVFYRMPETMQLSLPEALGVVSMDVLRKHMTVDDARLILEAAYGDEFLEWEHPRDSSQ